MRTVSNPSRRAAIWTLVLLLQGGLAFGADWPQFLGPQRDGASRETGLARQWPLEGPPVLWKTPVGAGFAGPVVRDGKVFLLDRIGDKQDSLRCFDLETGEEEWTFAYDAPGKFSYNGSRTAPAVDEEHAFIVGPLGDFHCVSLKTHQAVWKKHLLNDYDAQRPRWVVSTSPLLYRDMVIVAPQGRKAGVVALDKATGREVWHSGPVGNMAYVSPAITTIDGVDQVVIISGRGTVTGIDASNGKSLWTYRGWSCNNPIPTPAFADGGRIFVTGGYGAGTAMISVSRRDGKFLMKQEYKTQECGSQIHQPLLHEGHFYVNSNGNKRRDGLLCIDLEGNVKWKTGRRPNFERGGILLADGMIFAVDGDSGWLHLVEASPEGYQELAKFRAFKGKQAWAPLALSEGRLLIRSQREMMCVDVRAK
jgi:outer membrane protein assembly factor BamB